MSPRQWLTLTSATVATGLVACSAVWGFDDLASPPGVSADAASDAPELDATDDAGTVRYLDISAEQGAKSGTKPSTVIDDVNHKLLVVTQNDGNESRPSLFRCDLDGTGCVHKNLSGGTGAPSASGLSPSALIDDVNDKLLVVAFTTTREVTNFRSVPNLFRCKLDGTSCTYTSLMVGGLETRSSVVIDKANTKLLAVVADEAAHTLLIIRCDLLGQACTQVVLPSAGHEPSAVIDAVSNKLLVVTRTADNKNRPSLLRCDLDGLEKSCIHTDISTGAGDDSGFTPSAIIDSANGKLLVVTNNNTASPSLFRCNLNGTGCRHTLISAPSNADPGETPTALIDATNGKLLVVTSAVSRPGLFRCDLDGTNCSHARLSAVEGRASGLTPSPVIDAVNGNLLVVTGGPGLFLVGL